jgi:hypothetical protein
LLVSVVGDDLALRKGNRPGMETQNSGVAGDPSVIKLRVRDIAQLFNTLDASPFRIRDISPAVDQYIVDWAQELPQDQPIEIDVYLGSRDATERETSDISDAFRSWYTEKEKAETTAIRTLFRDARLSGPFARLMQESLVIIGWVVIWRPIEIFLYDWIPLVRRRKLYRRLAASKVTAVSATRPS